MAAPFEEGKCNHLALIIGERIHLSHEKAAQIGANEIVVDLVFHPRIGLALDLAFEPVLGSTVRLATAQAIDRPAPRQGYYPAKRTPCLGRIISRFLPDLKENFLQDIVRFRLLVDDTGHDRFESFAIAVVELAKRGL